MLRTISKDDAWLGQMIKEEQKRFAEDKLAAEYKALKKLKEKKLRKKHPALKEAWDRYKLLLALIEEQE